MRVLSLHCISIVSLFIIFCGKMDLGHEDADELVQDVFVKFWKQPIYEEKDTSLKVLLYRLAITSLLYYNLKHKTVAIRGLTSDQLLILVLKDQEQIDFMEIAQITGFDVNEVRNNFRTGLEKFNDLNN